jgi:palmitoyl-protein thioesterase
MSSYSTYSLYLLFLVLLILNGAAKAAYPVAIFHGIGDSCLINPGMHEIVNYFAKGLDVYAKCIETGGGPLDWLTSFNHQANKACNAIKEDKNFEGEFSVVGISQGSLLARYIIESCDMKGKVKRYVSIGGPQMGVGAFPQCTGGAFCNLVNKAVSSAVYFKLIQSVIGPAGYFKDPSNYQTYVNYSTFLADLNNEKEEKKNSHKDRFVNLEKVVLIKFSEDTMIIPRETAWFQFYDENRNVMKLEDTEFYQKDFIGLKQLNEENKIKFVELEGNHLNFDYEDIDKYMLPALK